MQNKQVFTFKAENGMIIAEDIINSYGQLIVSKGTVFSDKIRSILNANSIIEIPIYETLPLSDSNNIHNNIKESTLFEKIRNSSDYIKFTKKYDDGLNEFKLELNDIVDKNTTISPDKLVSIPYSITNDFNSSYLIFDILHTLNIYDDSTYAHSLNVALICSIFADWLHFNKADKKALIFAGMVHDIGKLCIPDKIIKKPSKLTEEEYNIIKTHPVLGYNIVKDRINDPRVKAAVLMHHEKCDKSGYPAKLPGDKIPDFAKIVTIADVYDAMTSKRVYRNPLCPFEVIRMFEKEGFEKYDTRFILTFLSNVGQTYVNNSVELNDGRIGKIVLINNNYLSKPTIIIDDDYIDLSKHSDLYIVNIL